MGIVLSSSRVATPVPRHGSSCPVMVIVALQTALAVEIGGRKTCPVILLRFLGAAAGDSVLQRKVATVVPFQPYFCAY
jgi:hypothetical protein